jgi:GNAT superfamily N-acetyltransferase
VSVRPLEQSDATALTPLLGVLGYPSSVKDVEARLAAILPREDFAAWVCEIDSDMVGFIGASVTPSFAVNGLHGRIVALVVDDTRQRQGIGGALLRAAEDWLRSLGALDVIVNSRLTRLDAHAFYESKGYDRTGLRFAKVLAGGK